MSNVSKGLALVALAAFLAGCIIIPVERHTSEEHHHYYGADKEAPVADAPEAEHEEEHD